MFAEVEQNVDPMSSNPPGPAFCSLRPTHARKRYWTRP